eukprot:g11619.t1
MFDVNLNFQDEDLTPERLFQLYYGGNVPASRFNSALENVAGNNILVDFLYFLTPSRHFDSETFEEGKAKILEQMACVIQNIEQGSFNSARKNMGRLLHPVQ